MTTRSLHGASEGFVNEISLLFPMTRTASPSEVFFELLLLPLIPYSTTRTYTQNYALEDNAVCRSKEKER